MIKNRIRKYFFIFCAAIVFALPSVADAQMTARQYQESIQKGEEIKQQADKGTDTGKNYGAGDTIQSGIDAAADRVESGVEDIKKGGIGGWLSGLWKIGTAHIAGTIEAVSNVDKIGQDKMIYTNPVTGEQEEYIKTVWGGAEAVKGNLKGCPPIGIQIIENRSCIFCPLFAVLFDAANEMCVLAFNKLAKSMSNVMLVGFAIFIVFKTLSMVSSLTKQDAPKYLMELLTQSLKVLISFLLLADASNIYGYFIIPVLGAGLEFGGSMLFSVGDTYQTCGSTDIPLIGQAEALLPLVLYAKLDCFIRAIQGEISIMQSVGSSLMCIGRHQGSGEILGMWDFGMVFNGLIVWIFAILLSLAFAFYLIDATVTLGLVGALMPFLIACWPFKMTHDYTKKGIETFLNTFFVFVFMGIVVSINVQLVGTALTDSNATASQSTSADQKTESSGDSTDKSSSSDGEKNSSLITSGSGAMTGMLEAINGEDMKKLKELTDIGFGGFLILLCCCIFGFKFTQQATTLAEKMSGGGLSIKGIGNKIGGLAASGVGNLTKKATQPARKAISNKASELTSRAGNAVGKRLGLGKHGGKTGDKKSGKQQTPPPLPSGQNRGGGASSNGNQATPPPFPSGQNRGNGPTLPNDRKRDGNRDWQDSRHQQ